MVLDGQHPAAIRNAVATPGGCTIGGLLTMEDGKIRSTMVKLQRNERLMLGKNDSRSDKCCKWAWKITKIDKLDRRCLEGELNVEKKLSSFTTGAKDSKMKQAITCDN